MKEGSLLIIKLLTGYLNQYNLMNDKLSIIENTNKTTGSAMQPQLTVLNKISPFSMRIFLFPVRRHKSKRLVRCLAQVFKIPRTCPSAAKWEIIQGHKNPKSLPLETSRPIEDLSTVRFPNSLFEALGFNVTRGPHVNCDILAEVNTHKSYWSINYGQQFTLFGNLGRF